MEGGGRKEKKRGGSGRSLLSEPQDSLQAQVPILRYSQEQNNYISFLLLCPLSSRDPALPSGKGPQSVLPRGEGSRTPALAIRGRGAVNTGQLREMGQETVRGRGRMALRQLLHGALGACYRESSPSQCHKRPPKKQCKTGNHKTQRVWC